MLWKLFLQATVLDSSAYLALVASGPCAAVPSPICSLTHGSHSRTAPQYAYSKIRNDSFRTFRSEKSEHRPRPSSVG